MEQISRNKRNPVEVGSENIRSDAVELVDEMTTPTQSAREVLMT